MRILFFLLAFSLAAASSKKEPTGPNHDLTKEIDFERMSTYPLGPTGAHGWMYVKKQMTHESRQILITEIEPGSPAEAVLEVGDVILGIGGKRFDSDARRAFGWAIVDAQGKDGKLQVSRWRPIADSATRRGVESEVTLQLPVLGKFADSAPYDCAVSAKLLETALERVMAQAKEKKFGRLQESLLALMAVGGPEQMAIVKDYLYSVNWAKPDYRISVERGSKSSWGCGMHGVILAEYYLATGDEYVLPALREHAYKIAMGQSGGGLWGHGFAWTSANDGKLHGSLGGYGALNLAGLPCLLTLVLAEKCDIRHAEISAARDRALPFFANFVGHGTIGYGYHRPSLDHYNNGRNGFSSNGKNAIAGLVHTLAGDREVSNYYAKLVTSSYDEREYGHAGNSFNRFWGMMGAAIGGPKAVAAFNHEMQWYRALCRGWDGRMLLSKLGGYYGGATLDLEAAQVLAMALPLRKLYITGKDADKSFWLNDEQVDSAISAGRWHWADYSKISTPDLIAALDCWSPGAREWMAVELSKREGDIVTPLLAALKSDSADQRAGAAAALGYQGERAANAVPALSKALFDPAHTVRVAAAYGIMRTGKPGRAAVPEMLRAIVELEGEGPLQPVLQALSFSLGAEYITTAPLYFVGILPQYPEDVNPLDGIDRDLLYAAFRRMATDRSGRIRDCGAYMLRWFDREDLKHNAWEIYNLVYERAPDYGMFSGRARGHGIDILARFQITEGPAVTVHAIETQGWGWFMISPHHFEALQKYGSLARDQLPWLFAARSRWSTGENRAIIEATIAAIEGDKEERKGLSLADLVGDRLPAGADAADLERIVQENSEDKALQFAAYARLLKNGTSAKNLVAPLNIDNRLIHQLICDLRFNLWTEPDLGSPSQQPPNPLAEAARAKLSHPTMDRRITAIKLLGRLFSETGVLTNHAQDCTDSRELAAIANALAKVWHRDFRPDPGGFVEKVEPVEILTLARVARTNAMDELVSIYRNGTASDKNLLRSVMGMAPLPSDHAPKTDRFAYSFTERLLGIAELSNDRRRRFEIADILHLRLIMKHVTPGSETALARAIIRLADNTSMTARVLQQLRWAPSKDAFELALEHFDEAATDRAEIAKSMAAAQAIVDMAPKLKSTPTLKEAVARAKRLLPE